MNLIAGLESVFCSVDRACARLMPVWKSERFIFFDWRFKNVFFDSQSGHDKLHFFGNNLPRFRPCAV